jgi:hypothetical protein
MHSDTRGRAANRTVLVYLLVLLVVLVIFAGDFLLSPSLVPSSSVGQSDCGSSLSSQLSSTYAGLCLRPILVSISGSNGSDMVVPVLVMKEGTTTTVDILYQLSSEMIGQQVPHRNVTAAQVPSVLSVLSGQLVHTVTFSNASLIFADKEIMIYSYVLTASPGSSGYYALLPPFYYGMYPVLAVGVDPSELNSSALSMWGYAGTIMSAEVTIPSTIVGTGDLSILNATVPMISYCPNSACVIISRSGD